jgi:hypothetical protein
VRKGIGHGTIILGGGQSKPKIGFAPGTLSAARVAPRRLGQLIREWQEAGRIAKRGQPSKEKGHHVPLVLEDALGEESDAAARHVSKRAQALLDVPEDAAS